MSNVTVDELMAQVLQIRHNDFAFTREYSCLYAELEALIKDRERLEWLIEAILCKHDIYMDVHDNKIIEIYGPFIQGKGSTPREAIDATMEKEKKCNNV